MKVGHKIKCISIIGPDGKSSYLKLGQYYTIENFEENVDKNGSTYIVVDVGVFSSKRLISYHTEHFQTLKQDRKDKLGKLNEK
jgi:hypothetical protein